MRRPAVDLMLLGDRAASGRSTSRSRSTCSRTGSQPLAYATPRYVARGRSSAVLTLARERSLPHRPPRPRVLVGARGRADLREPARLRLRARLHDRVDGRARLRDDCRSSPASFATLRRRSSALTRALLARGGDLVRRRRARRRRRRRRLLGEPAGRRARAARPPRTWAAYSVAIAPLMRALLAVPDQRARARASAACRSRSSGSPQLASAELSDFGWLVWVGVRVRRRRAARS